MIRNSIAALVLVACGGAQPAAGPEVRDVPPPAPVAASAERADPIPAACRGSSLDLNMLALSGECDVGGTADPLAANVEVALASDKLAASSGEPAVTSLVLTNRGAAGVRVSLDASCQFANLSGVELYSEAGIRLDTVGTERCSEPRSGCAGHVIAVWLEPGGTATIPVRYAARVTVADSRSCESHTGRALVPGRYRAVIKSPLVQQPLRASLAVAKLEMLSVGRCASYARKLAAKAEPDASRRTAVAAEIAAQCRRSPPRQSLVDCQMAAETEAALAACKPAE